MLFGRLILLVFLLMAQLHCVVGCSRTFVENRQLSRHKKSCVHVQRLREASRDARKARWTYARFAKPSGKSIGSKTAVTGTVLTLFLRLYYADYAEF